MAANDLVIIRGDDELLLGVVTDPENGDAPVDLTAVTAMRFVIKKSDRKPDSEAIAIKTLSDGVVLTDAANGEFSVLLDHDETMLYPVGSFVWGLQIVDGAGKVNERTRGKIKIQRDVVLTTP